MKRTTVNFWIDLVSFVVFLALVLTGLVIYYVLPPCGNCTGAGCAEGQAPTLWGLGRHDFGAVHFYLALATVALVIVHVCLHWTWVCQTVCKLAGLNVTTPERGRFWGALLLIVLMTLTIAVLYLAKTQVR